MLNLSSKCQSVTIDVKNIDETINKFEDLAANYSKVKC
jgi:hypothetical protein